MIDALQVFVRGFQTRERGDVILEYLGSIGFKIEEAFDGHSDNLGGLIETNIVYQDNLSNTDPEAMLTELRRLTGFDGLWLQTREFRLAEEGEYGRQDDEQAPQASFRVVSAD